MASSHSPLSLPARASVLRSLCTDGDAIAVSGDSMWPTLRDGERIIVDSRAEPRVGEVVVFVDGLGRIVVHRLVAVLGRRRVCLGDNRLTFDPIISEHQIVGVAVETDEASDADHHRTVDRTIARTTGLGWIRLTARCLRAGGRVVAGRTAAHLGLEVPDAVR